MCKELVHCNKALEQSWINDENIYFSEMRTNEMMRSMGKINDVELERKRLALVFIRHGIHCSACGIARFGNEKREWKSCTRCKHSWCCSSDHWNQYNPKHSKEICDTYMQLSGIARFKQDHLVNQNEEFEFMPKDRNGCGLMNSKTPTSFFSTWTHYFQARCHEHDILNMHHPYFFPSATEKLSQVCTTLYGMQLLGWKNFIHKKKSELVIHIVGATIYEGKELITWEEIMHLCPNLIKLTVYLIGPQTSQQQAPDALDNCPTCQAMRKVVLVASENLTYHEYMETERWIRPDIIVAFNTGMYDEYTNLWKESLTRILAREIPCVFTSYNADESQGDNRVLQELGAKLVTGPNGVLNPFRDMDPKVEFTGKDTFYHNNFYLTCFQGLEKGKK